MSDLFTIKYSRLIGCGDLTAVTLAQSSHVTFWKTEEGGFCLTYLMLSDDVSVEHHVHLGKAGGHPQSTRATQVIIENAQGQTTEILRSNFDDEDEIKAYKSENKI